LSEDGTNGKTAEQLKKEKFDADPNRFIDIDELIIAVKKETAGVSKMVNIAMSRRDITAAIGELMHEVNAVLSAMDMQAHMRAQGVIEPLKKPHGIFDFARRKK
jgi:hypothetical protein